MSRLEGGGAEVVNQGLIALMDRAIQTIPALTETAAAASETAVRLILRLFCDPF